MMDKCEIATEKYLLAFAIFSRIISGKYQVLPEQCGQTVCVTVRPKIGGKEYFASCSVTATWVCEDYYGAAEFVEKVIDSKIVDILKSYSPPPPPATPQNSPQNAD